MRALNGNTAVRLSVHGSEVRGVAQLCLHQLIPVELPDAMIEYPVYDKNFLLGCRAPNKCHNFTPPQTTTQFHCSAVPASTFKRRRKIILPTGDVHFSKVEKSTRIKRIRRIQELHTSTVRPPPPRGAPGAPHRSHEECTPSGVATPGRSRGAKRRIAQRRAYRCWCRAAKKVGAKEVGPPCLVTTRPKKAALSRAAWFRRTLFWQEQFRRRKGRKIKNLPTATPIGYGSGFRFGALNVQGFADTLKL